MGYLCGSLDLVRRYERPWMHELETLNEGISERSKERLGEARLEYCLSTVVIYPRTFRYSSLNAITDLYDSLGSSN